MVSSRPVALMAVLVLIFFHISGAAVPVESRLLSVEQILQVPQDLLHLILGGILLLLVFFILEAMCICFFCKGPKFDKDSRRGPDVVDLQQLIRIGQVVLLLLLILLLSTLPLLILGIVHRCFLMKKKSPSCVHVVVAVSTDLKKNFQLFPGAGRWPERASGLVDLCPAK